MSREQFAAIVLAAIERHYPDAPEGNQDQIAECTAVLAISLGGMLAYAATFAGQEFVDEWEELVLAIIRKETAEILTRTRDQAMAERRH